MIGRRQSALYVRRREQAGWVNNPSKSFPPRQTFTMIRCIAKSELIPFGTFEPEVHIVFPGKADAAIHLYSAIGRAGVHVRQTSFGK